MNRTLIFLIFLFPSPPLLGDDFNIAIGESLRLPTHPMEDLSFQKKGLVSLKDLGSKIILTGKKLGETRFTMGQKTHHIRILKKNLFESLKQIQKWSTGKRGPKIHVTNKHIFIGGRLLSFHDFRNLKKFTKENSEFRITAHTSERLQKKILNHVMNLLKEANLTPGTLSFKPPFPVKNRQKKSKTKKSL